MSDVVCCRSAAGDEVREDQEGLGWDQDLTSEMGVLGGPRAEQQLHVTPADMVTMATGREAAQKTICTGMESNQEARSVTQGSLMVEDKLRQ